MDENRKYKKMIGETIYRLRKEKGLTQTELGNLVGVSNKAVSKWETDEANPDISIVPILAQSLGVTSDELLNGLNAEKGGLTALPVSTGEELSVKKASDGGVFAKRNKKRAIIISGVSAAVVLIVFLSVFFTALTRPFKGFDNDEAIVRGRFSVERNAVTTNFNGVYTFNGEFDGVDRIKTVSIPENPTFYLSLKINSGRFKVVLVKDGKVFVVCDKSTTDAVKMELTAGRYNLRIVGEEADIDFEIDLEMFTT